MMQLIIDRSPIIDVAVLFDTHNKDISNCIMSNRFKENVLNAIYLGKVINIVDAIDGAFVDIGLKQNAFIKKNEVLKSLGISVSDAPLSTLISLGSQLMVQVTKEPYKSKGAQLTGDISITGKYVVLLPCSQGVRFSKKLDSDFIQSLVEKGIHSLSLNDYGLIIRSGVESVPYEKILHEICNLINEWDKIKNKAKLSQKTMCLYDATPFYALVESEVNFEEVDSFIVTTQDAVHYLNTMGVDKKRIRLIIPKTNVWQEQGIDLEKIFLSQLIALDKGVSITLDEAEAFTVIDVNSSRYIGSNTKDDTALKVNTIVAQQLSKLLKLRNIGGMIVVDFIQMSVEDEQQFEKILQNQYLKKEMGFTVLGFTKMGLFEIIKKRERPSIYNLMCLDFKDKDLLYWKLYQLYNDVNRLANHTNTKKLEIELPLNMYQFLKQNDVLSAFNISCHIKPMKESNKSYRLQSLSIDIT